MNRSFHRPILGLCPLLLLAMALVAPSHAAPPRSRPRATTTIAVPDSDGTKTERWTLPNGLRVVTRHVPYAHTAAVTLCYRLGTREDAHGSEGFAELAAQVAMTAHAGDVPERTIAELDQLRPAGWSIKVSPHITELTEAAPIDLLPGVLHQVCQRFHTLTITDTLVRHAMTDVHQRLLDNYDTRADRALYFLSAELTAGRSADQAMRYATGKGIEHLDAKALSHALAERLVPANSVLCVVGDFGALDVRRIVTRELAALPAGTAAPPIPWGKLASARARVNRSDLKTPIGVVAIVAPALTDSLHPYFTAFTLSAGSAMNGAWGQPEPPLTNRFQYSMATDPELVRFYPSLPPGNEDPAALLSSELQAAADAIIDTTSLEQVGRSSAWLVGGPMPAALVKRAREDATVIHTLATTLAALEQYGDADFWARYRLRLYRAARLDLAPLFRYYVDPHHQVTFVMAPGS